MKTYEYPVFAFRQQEESPVQVAFVAYAGDIVDWAGVPRKSDELLTGYQRFRDSNRIDREILPFFQDSKNSSPTAIIVALHQSSGVGKCTLTDSDIPIGVPTQTTLTIKIDDERLAGDQVFVAAQNYVNSRLQSDSEFTDIVEESVEDQGEEELLLTDEESEDESSGIAHLGTVTLRRMKELLDDNSKWNDLNFREAVTDYVKPAFIIDGQHRVAGAAKLGEKGLPFVVCGLYNAPWEEQVFQFTVVNLKPKRIAPAIITSIAGLSLTSSERARVEDRLSKAGVKMHEVTVMSLVSYDEESPFAELVDMKVGGAIGVTEKLGYGAMKRIAMEWYRASRTSLTLIAKELYETNSANTARKRWRDERLWFGFFCSFWSTIRDHYSPNLWQKSPSNHLLIGAQLWALQEVILRRADYQASSHWKIEEKEALLSFEDRFELLQKKLLEVIAPTIEYFPEAMWTKPWAKTGYDTNAGREELVKHFQRFIDEGMKSSGKNWRGWEKSDLFKGTDTK